VAVVHLWARLAASLCGIRAMTTTSGFVGPSAACMCGNGCMPMDGGFQAVRAAGENLKIRTLLQKKVFQRVNSRTF
jgi:hypothetical protein